MKNPDVVFKELGELYDFYKEIAKFKIKRAAPDAEKKEPAPVRTKTKKFKESA